MHHKVDVIVSIDLVNEPSERRLSDRAVGHVADQGERKWRYAVSPVRRLIGRNAKVKGDGTTGRGSQPFFSWRLLERVQDRGQGSRQHGRFCELSVTSRSRVPFLMTRTVCQADLTAKAPSMRMAPRLSRSRKTFTAPSSALASRGSTDSSFGPEKHAREALWQRAAQLGFPVARDASSLQRRSLSERGQQIWMGRRNRSFFALLHAREAHSCVDRHNRTSKLYCSQPDGHEGGRPRSACVVITKDDGAKTGAEPERGLHRRVPQLLQDVYMPQCGTIDDDAND